MSTVMPLPKSVDEWDIERKEWLESIDYIHERYGESGVKEILRELQNHILNRDIVLNEATLNTPYRNTIPPAEEPLYPGDIELEQRIEKILRWNAAAMIARAADSGEGLGGHIATYTSAATMMEVGLNHVFRCRSDDYGGAVVIFQPHASPGNYARALLEGRLTTIQLDNFRRQLAAGGGLSSYPHPRHMADFWQVPCASMGLSTPTSIYLARFAKYLENRGLKPANGGKVWCFIGDGEADEPEVLGTVNIAAREKLDNLVLIVNCNLQRLDGPVRGNGKIIQELERSFRGADWNVIKVIWGSGWDPLLARDRKGVLQKRMEEAVDGDYQYLSISPGNIQRELWVANNPELNALMNSLTDEEVRLINRGGQDPKKIYAAYQRALQSQGKPTVILIKSVKGYGLGKGQGRNTAHQKKQLSAEERLELAANCDIPLERSAIERAEPYLPATDSVEIRYLREHRERLGGYLPARRVDCLPLPAPDWETFNEFFQGTGERAVSSTMAMVRILTKLLKHPDLGRYIVPIVPDEARTFGLEGLFKDAGIYAPEGQKYTPVDGASLLPYREAGDGQILQEGICETGAMASFLAAGTAYAVHGVPTGYENLREQVAMRSFHGRPLRVSGSKQ
jgi:pyruvate dehydrogenase E1 component